MDIFNLFRYLLIGGMFFFILSAFIAINQTLRQRLLVGYMCLFLLTWSTFVFKRDIQLSIWLINIMAFGFAWPMFIGLLIAPNRAKPVVISSKANNAISAIIGLSSLSLITIFILIPHKISSIDHKPIYDEEYFRTSISLLLFVIPAWLAYAIITIRKNTIFTGGILHNGILWAWSDFESYSWNTHQKNDSLTELVIVTKKPGFFWKTRPVRFVLSFENKQTIDDILKRNIKDQK